MTPPPALVLAPHGRDSAIAAALLREAGIAARICASMAELNAGLGDEICCAVFTEEALADGDFAAFRAWIGAQPSWSDLPVVVLVNHGGGLERNPVAAELSDLLGNVTFLERPFHPTTFVSVARTARKARQRQLEARAHLQELRRMNETLEHRVRQRTADLQTAHQVVLEQMAERHRAEEQLRQVQKIETIGQLTGGVAHDFNNLLMAVLGNLQLLRKRLPDDPRLMRLLDGAVQGARRGAVLTQRLLAFARRQDLQPSPVDLLALVGGMRDLLAQSVGPAIEIAIELPPSAPAVMADQNQIESALLNLVINARDALPGGGRIAIGLEVAEREKACDLRPGAYVAITVGDNGVGMDAETLKRAIEPFFSTKELGKGTGLGLSMVHGLAVQLNGALRLSSAPDQGTRAELWLPVAMGPVPASFPQAPAHPAAGPGSARILVVDDDRLVSASTTVMLEDLGHAVIETGSGAEALGVLQGDAPIDLMITDYAMPRMTGLDLARAARAVRPGLLVLLATGYADLPEGEGSDLPRLSKPYSQEQLSDQIAAVLATA